MFITASSGKRRAEVIAHDIHGIVNISLNQIFKKNQTYHFKTYTKNPIQLSSKSH